jgi:hypothetical protein
MGKFTVKLNPAYFPGLKRLGGAAAATASILGPVWLHSLHTRKNSSFVRPRAMNQILNQAQDHPDEDMYRRFHELQEAERRNPLAPSSVRYSTQAVPSRTIAEDIFVHPERMQQVLQRSKGAPNERTYEKESSERQQVASTQRSHPSLPSSQTKVTSKRSWLSLSK